jgi:hypothetical protein
MMVLKLARLLGLLSTITILILWGLLAYRTQFYSLSVTDGTWLLIALMLVLAAAGLLVTLLDKPYPMLIFASISFFPVGLYLLGVPNACRLIGVADLTFLFASLIMLSQRNVWQRG